MPWCLLLFSRCLSLLKHPLIADVSMCYDVALLEAHTTPSVIDVSRLLDHACGTCCRPNHDSATLSESSNGCQNTPVWEVPRCFVTF